MKHAIILALALLGETAALVAVATVEADYAEGENSAALITPDVETAAERLMGAAVASNLLHAVRLQMAKYDRDMRSDGGRRAWHGRIVRSEVYANDECAVEVYSNELDGAIWRYRRPFARRDPKAEVLRANSRLTTTLTNGLPARLVEAMARREGERNSASNVTVKVEVGGASQSSVP